MKQVFALLCSFAVGVASADAWSPPRSPTKEDVLRISREAVDDAQWAHALAVRWLDVGRELDWIGEMLAYDRGRSGGGSLVGRVFGNDFHERSYVTIIALLAVNWRMAEARRVAERARRELQLDALPRRVERALSGTVPPALRAL